MVKLFGPSPTGLLQRVNHKAYLATGCHLRNDGAKCRTTANASPTYFLGLRKPLIAAINGAAAGLGFSYATFCDMRFMDRNAKDTSRRFAGDRAVDVRASKVI